MSRRQLATTLLAAVLGGGVTATVLAAAEERPPGDGGLLASVTSTGAPPLSMDELFLAAAPSVVAVRASTVQAGAFTESATPLQDAAVSAGSGFVLDEEGHILTSARVVSGVTHVEVTFAEPPGVTVSARVVGKDEETDLAVLQVDPGGLDLDPLELADSATVREGDRTLVLANPSGYEPTAGSGEVLDPSADIGTDDGAVLEDVIRTDAVILPASAGGPLLGDDGRVIGIASRMQDETSFAVPADTAAAVLKELEKGYKVIRPYLGLDGRTADNVQGVLVEAVYPGGPAAAAGIQAGDVVEEIDGEPVATLEALLDQVEAREPGDPVVLRISRGGVRSERPVTVAERPATLPAER